MSPGGENLLDFLGLRQVLSSSDWDLRDPLCWPQERTVPMRVARGPLGIPLPLMPGPKTSCGVVPEPEDYSPVLTWNLGYFWSLPSGVSPRLLGACTCAFLPSYRSSVALPFAWIKGSVAFTRAFPTGSPTCHRGVSRSLACKWKQCRENRFPWNGLRHLGDLGNGGTTLDFLSPVLWRAPPLEM